VGWYTDLVLQGVWYDSIQARTTGAESLSTDGLSLATSVEAGYTLLIDSHYSVVPQAQLIYQRTNISNTADAFSQISFEATNELYGRIGGRLAGEWKTGDWEASDSIVTIWSEANLWRQIGNDAKTTFASLQGANPTTFAVSLGDTWAQFGVGFSGQITRNASFFSQADYNTTIGNSGHSLNGRLGFKIIW
jgi:outer membrane autotransporter protein